MTFPKLSDKRMLTTAGRKMQDCQWFETRLISGIPYDNRYGIEHTLKSFQQSQVMLAVLQSALKNSSLWSDSNSVTAVAFGSFGRLDASPLLSDFDMLLIYHDPTSDTSLKTQREAITKLVSANKCLTFDHRAELEAGKFNFDSSPAYPVLSADQVTSDETRALQFVTEGRLVFGEERGQQIRQRLLTAFGFASNPHMVDSSRFRAAMNKMKASYCKHVIGRLKARGNVTNRKVLKLFALREFSYLATLFAVADAALGTIPSLKLDYAARALSSPSVLKITSFGDAVGALAQVLSTHSPEVRKNVMADLRAKFPEAVAGAVASGATDSEGVLAAIRGMVLPLLRSYNELLAVLHDPGFVERLDTFEPDITTWMADRAFSRILESRKRLIDLVKAFAGGLLAVIQVMGGVRPSAALEDAAATLSLILDYRLELSL